ALREDLPPSLQGKAAPLIDRILAREREIAEVVTRLQKETEEIAREEKLEKKPAAGTSGGSGTSEGPGSLRGAFAGRYQKYAEWPLPRKVLFGSAVSVPPLVFLTSIVAYFWIAGVGKELLNLYPLVWLLSGYTLWLVLCVLVARVFIRRAEESRVPAYLFLVGVLFLCFGLLRLFGTVSSAVFAIFPGLLTYHSIFFDTRVGWTGFFAAITGMLFLAWGDLSGAWTYAPLFYQRRIDDQLLPIFYFSLLLTVWTSFTWVFVQVQLAERLRLARQREIEEATTRLATMKEELAHAEAKAAAGKVVMDLIPRLLTPLTRNEPDLKELEREFAAAPGEISKDDLEAVGRILRAEARAMDMVGRLEELPKPGTGPVLS
ncbi:MAG: hypothetical protein AB1405_18725, partial [Bdellovibrionota bacterium]